MSQLANDSPASTDVPTESAGGDRDSSEATTEQSPAEEGSAEKTAPENDDDAGADREFPLDQVFDILKNSRRRQVLELLADADRQVTLSEVAEQIAAWENDKEIRQITSSERKRVYVGLYQCHLPKMDSMGIISFNKPRGTVEIEDGVDVFYDYLDTADEPVAPPWHAYSVGLSLGCSAVLAGALLLAPLTAFPVVNGAVGTVILSFLVYAAASLLRQRAEREDVATDDA